MGWGLLLTLGRVAFTAAAPAVTDALATSIARSGSSKRQKKIRDLYNLAAASNELLERVRHMADPAQNMELKTAMLRHRASFKEEADRAARLRDEALRAQRDD